MSGRPLAITQKQVTAILKGAEKAGIRLKIKFRDGELVFTADEEDGAPAPPPRKEPNFDI